MNVQFLKYISNAIPLTIFSHISPSIPLYPSLHLPSSITLHLISSPFISLSPFLHRSLHISPPQSILLSPSISSHLSPHAFLSQSVPMSLFPSPQLSSHLSSLTSNICSHLSPLHPFLFFYPCICSFLHLSVHLSPSNLHRSPSISIQLIYHFSAMLIQAGSASFVFIYISTYGGKKKVCEPFGISRFSALLVIKCDLILI